MDGEIEKARYDWFEHDRMEVTTWNQNGLALGTIDKKNNFFFIKKVFIYLEAVCNLHLF